MSQSLNALIVSASSEEARDLVETLRESGLDVAAERTEDPAAVKGLRNFDLALLDPDTPGVGAEEVERLAGQVGSVLVVGNGLDPEHVAGLMRAGAQDVVLRSHLGRLPEVVQRELRHAAEQDVRFHAALLDEVHAAVCALDLELRITHWNRGAEELFGWSREEALGRTERELGLAAEDLSLGEKHRTLLAGRKYEREFVARRRDGTTFPAHARDAPVHDAAGEIVGFVAVYQDLTERRRAERQIAYLSDYDGVTALPNRRVFRVHAELAVRRALRSGAAAAVLQLDLNRFRLVNESLGHAAGDDLLRQTASRLREVMGPMDFLARQGEDEFLVLMADIPGDAAAAGIHAAEDMAETMHRALEQPFELLGVESFIGATIGISVCPVDAEDADTMLTHPSAALHEARRLGLAPWVVFSDETLGPAEELSLASRLRGAIDRDELVLHYQPVVDLQMAREQAHDGDRVRRSMVGVEALVRWCDPERGVVSPADFIPLAEETGLIEPIGDWVVDEVCRQTRTWQHEGRQLEVAFNMSPRQLWKPELVRRLLSEVERLELDSRRMTVEVTESAAMADPERTEEVLGELHRSGFMLAIDDFGAGHSSLTRLGRMPADRLKIDRSFVMRLPHDDTAAKMIVGMIELAGALGMSAVAEGIETEEQLQFLAEHGCGLGQGFLFGRGVPARELPL